jgi:2-polyprenyl-3-methyl-5-hydroxy-6-metoxy-1,4-benzoquinol methylase
MKNIPSAAAGIDTDFVPDCYLCGARGVLLYEGLRDAWFGAPGSWTLKRCPKPECGLVWMDPMPTREDVWKGYRMYFTHRDYSPEDKKRIDRLGQLLVKVHKPLYKLFWHASGFRKVERDWRKRGDELFLNERIPGGRLLDIGCGKGDFLARMRGRGWEVEGLEVDSEAVKFACSRHGLTIHHGALETLGLPDGSFDAVTANHVIEHVHEPIALLRECLRVLKPGGVLVLATPNINSDGHRVFGRNWSNLDPPRHLHLFSGTTLKECGIRAGFQNMEVFSVPGYAEGAIQASVERAEGERGEVRGEFAKWLDAALLKIRVYYRFFVKGNREVGEEVIMKARKEF